MPNSIKYSVNAETLALKKGNFWIGTGDVGKGPTSETDYWNGITPPLSGYTIYINKLDNGPSIYVPHNDDQLIDLTNKIGNTTYASVNECLNYYNSQSDKMILNRDYESIKTDGLILNVDPGFTPSYPENGTSIYDISNVGNNGELMNGVSYSGGDGGGSLLFDGVSGYVTIPNSSSLVFGNGDFSVNIWIKFPISSTGEGGSWGPIVSKGCSTMAPAGSWWVSQTNTQTNRVTFNISSTSGGTFVSSIQSTTFPNGWNNVCVTRNGSTSSIYSNGVLTSTDNTSESNLTSTSPLTLCSTFTNGITTQRTKTSLSAVMLYNRSLSGQEILENYNTFKGRFVPPIDPDAQLFLTAANITNNTQITAVNNLVISMKSSGIWTKMLAIYPFVGGDAYSHKWNLKNPIDLNSAFRLQFFGGVTHTSNGVQGNATNGYANTFLVQQTIRFSGGVSTYILNNISQNGSAIRADNGSARISQIFPRATDNNLYVRHYSQSSITISNLDSRGFYATSRINNDQVIVNLRGVNTTYPQLVDVASSSFVPEFYIMAGSTFNGGATSFGSHQIAFTTIHNDMTSNDLNSLYSIVTEYQTTLNRQI
jgi:hypothetical protein